MAGDSKWFVARNKIDPEFESELIQSADHVSSFLNTIILNSVIGCFCAEMHIGSRSYHLPWSFYVRMLVPITKKKRYFIAVLTDHLHFLFHRESFMHIQAIEVLQLYSNLNYVAFWGLLFLSEALIMFGPWEKSE